MNKQLRTNLTSILEISNQKEQENERFRAFLKNQNGEYLDEKVQQLNEIISPQYRLHNLWQLLQKLDDCGR